MPRPSGVPRLARACRVVFALAVMLASTLHALAQDAGPFTAIVSQDHVEARAGASNDFYSVGKLERGTRVTVVELMNGWNVIVPPPGVHSYIAKADVSASSDGKTGTVTADKAIVRALGPKGANKVESYRPQPSLTKGATVEIVSDSGEYYIIVPPKNAVVYLAPGTVRRVEASSEAPKPAAPAAPAAEPAKPVAPAKPAHIEPAKPKAAPLQSKPEVGVTDAAAAGAVPPAAGGSGEPAAVVMDGTSTTKPAKANRPAKTRPATPATGDAATESSNGAAAAEEKPASRGGAVFVPVARPAAAAEAPHASSVLGDSQAVRDMETKLAAAAKQPIDKRPLAELLAGYQKLSDSTDLSPTDRKIVSVRIGQIQENLALQKAVAAAESVRKESSQPITLPPPPPAPKPGVYNPADYDAVGQMLASTVYDGDASPRLFRIADPATQRTVAYVLPGPKVDVQQLIGKIVGVKGEAKYDPALHLRVITVDKIDLLQADEPTK